MTPKLIIHGGASSDYEGGHHSPDQFRESIQRIVDDTYRVLTQTSARQAVVHGLQLLEDAPLFNAGTGSRIQGDGQIRMSAALMDSETEIFSGVINVQDIQHPIVVANQLAQERHRVLAGEKASLYARDMGLPAHNPATPHRLKEYENHYVGKSGTVGVVALDGEGHLCAGTSTGGTGSEIPGRVSDAATVAGTYCNKYAAVSCTGTGEEIMTLGLASKVVTRVQDGMTLTEATQKAIGEGNDRNFEFGLIGITAQGEIVHDKTNPVHLVYGWHDSEKTQIF